MLQYFIKNENERVFFSPCLHLCLKSAIVFIRGIINFMPCHGIARMNTMFEETVCLSVTAGVDTELQNHRLLFSEV